MSSPNTLKAPTAESGEYRKPLPTITEDNRPFWDGARNGRLMMQRCRHCDHTRYPVARICPRCLFAEAEWVELSGRGAIFSYVVFHQVYDKSFKDDVPYNVALIQLDEGPRLFSNIKTVDGAKPKVGDRVEVCFDPVTPDVTLPRFRLAG
jgi:uncharacterized OB-fold protein